MMKSVVCCGEHARHRPRIQGGYDGVASHTCSEPWFEVPRRTTRPRRCRLSLTARVTERCEGGSKRQGVIASTGQGWCLNKVVDRETPGTSRRALDCGVPKNQKLETRDQKHRKRGM